MTHMREEYNVADTAAVCQEHNQAVDTDAQPSCRRQTIFQRGHEVIIHHMSFIIAGSAVFHLFLEAFTLVDRIVELGEAIADLSRINEAFKTVCNFRICFTAFGQR